MTKSFDLQLDDLNQLTVQQVLYGQTAEVCLFAHNQQLAAYMPAH